MMVLKLWSKYR